jgi:O-methyltransferase
MFMKLIITKILYFFLNDINRNDISGVLHKAWGHIFNNNLTGDYVEFGVYRGLSFFESIKQYNRFRSWLRNEKKSKEEWRSKLAYKSPLNNDIFFHGFDTFSGMPNNNEKNAAYAEGNFKSSLDKLKKKSRKSKFFFLQRFIF